ncbi:MAG: STT3 domain-containing protein [Sulfuricurvum sp.]|uniref:STT3 domain-containing protein n=1 Tax=Sulfuricurvum sp. TaxID=2025608 RepID=UPI002631DA19|nr:STT3 domain-containing protein [Sulfuricurvum sp.]MDD2367837.1 STT3 domain-containing protein [Sulfuricurvum sp.]MDD2949204.1 STT3 domain-containing protein [Sulfuricurvum sp.]MDD5117207.1 STT3 domain-containing protein [Sulfuricurvum sp.]
MNFSLPNEKHTALHLIILLIIAYTFSVGLRLIWIHWASGIPEFSWNHQIMINTNDGYYFAASAQNALTQIYGNNPRIDNEWATATVAITALLSKVMPIETIILYLPIFISSLVVIPLILIGRLYNAPYFGFFSALLASIGWSYYNRTMAGYYDTDMFSAMAPMLIVYFLMATTIKENILWVLLSAFSIMLYPFLYDQGLSIVYAISLFYMAYMVIFHRREAFTYFSIAIIAIALFSFSPLIKIPLIASLSIAYQKERLNFRLLLILSILAFALFLFNGNVLSLILAKITGYTAKGTENEALHFFQVAQTVREAGKIPFSEIANRISGSMLTFFIAFIGYGALVIRHRAFILALPLIGIGLFSFWGGLRFTIYAVPVAALGALYFAYLISETIANKTLKYSLITILTALMIYPNIAHIIEYKTPTVLTAKEVASLEKLKNVSQTKDYTIGWWDYGYPIWFYTHTNTLIDGGKHDHDNFLVSEILTTSSQIEAARLARIVTETYISSGYKEIADTLFYDKNTSAINVSDYLDTLRYEDSIPLPLKTRDIYFYLPWRMIDIFPTVALFGNLDLNHPDNRQQPFFFSSSSMQDTGQTIELGNGLSINKAKSTLKIGQQDIPIKKFYQVGYDQNNHLQVNEQTFASDGLNVIYLESYGRFLVMDDYYLNSTYIQMFIFEHYDKNLFEPVSLDPMTKLYRLKI